MSPSTRTSSVPSVSDMTGEPAHSQTRAELIVTVVFALWFGLLAIAHVVQAGRFEAMIPTWLPAPTFLNIVSTLGLAAISVLLVRRRTRFVGALAAALMLLVLQIVHLDDIRTAVSITQNDDGEWIRNEGEGSRPVLIGRTLFQLVSIGGALWLARNTHPASFARHAQPR